MASFFFKNSLIYCRFSFHCKTVFSAIQKLKLFSLLKIKEGLKTATKLELLFLLASFENIKNICKGVVKKAKSL